MKPWWFLRRPWDKLSTLNILWHPNFSFSSQIGPSYQHLEHASLNTIPAENHEQAWAFLMVYNILCVQFHVSYQITADTHDVL